MNVFGLFAKQPQAGTVKTRLAKSIGDAAAADLYAAFIADLIERFRNTADRRLLGYAPANAAAREFFQNAAQNDYTLWPQPDVDLGGRMAAFFHHAFQSGADRVVLIGSDSPTLPTEFVRRAFDELHQADCVLGPAGDGGYYLIGLRRELPRVFHDITWSGPAVLRQTVERLQSEAATLKLLPLWYDVDCSDDVEFLRGHLAALQAVGKGGCAPRTAAFLEQTVVLCDD